MIHHMRNVIFIIISILLGGGLVIFFLLKNKPSQQTPSASTPTPKTISSETQKTQTTIFSIAASTSAFAAPVWQSASNTIFCYTISYPSTFRLTTNEYGLLNLTTYDKSIELPESASPPGIGIQIQRTNLPVSTTLEDFMQKENSALAEDNKNALPGEIMSSDFTPVALGAFRYSQETLAGPGGRFTSFLASTDDTNGYYTALVWNKNIDPLTVNGILTSFSPKECASSTATSTP